MRGFWKRFIFCACLCAGWLSSADSYGQLTFGPHTRHLELITKARNVAPIAVDGGFGEQISLYDGSVGFNNVDISVPGNNELSVEFRRSFSIDNRWGGSGIHLGGLGNWDIDIPHLSGVFSTDVGGWRSANGGLQRCSQTGPPPNFGFTSAYEYWSGYRLNVPGGASQTLLKSPNASIPSPSNGTNYPWITKDFWRISCQPSTANGYPGEAFVATSPTGVKYYLDWVIIKDYPVYKIPGISGGGSTVHRQVIYFAVTKVEDRHGNWVHYNYSGANLISISSSDGRFINLNYSADVLSSAVANGRTWTYNYSVNGAGQQMLVQVARPDGSKWTYSGGGYPSISPTTAPPPPGNFEDPTLQCSTPLELSGDTFQYIVTAPSGSTATFNLEVFRHYRNAVPKYCNAVSGNGGFYYLIIPNHFDSFTLTSRIVTGPGLPTMSWAYAYNTVNGFFYDECVLAGPEFCLPSKTTTVNGPNQQYKRYEFGALYNENDGQLLSVEEGTGPDNILKKTVNYYVSRQASSSQFYPMSVGEDPLDYTDKVPTTWLRPIYKTVISQGGNNFIREVQPCGASYCFDVFARPTLVKRSSDTPGNPVRTDLTEYFDAYPLWSLGHIKKITNIETGIVVSRTEYNSSTALPYRVFRYEKIQQTLGYHGDGTLYTVTDGRNNTTTLTNWTRGIPQNVLFADGKSQSATVNDNGWITAVVDENGYSTGYGYDPMGRLSGVSYPSGDTVVWNTESTSFASSNTGAYGLPAGHWRATRVVGNKLAITYYDALLRPVVEEQYDTTSPATTRTMIVKRYDADGRLVFQSYPRASIGSYTDSYPGTTTIYDALGRVTATQQDSELGPLISTMTYRTGLEVEIKNPKQFTTVYGYFALDEPSYESLAWSIQPEGKTIQIDRDALGFVRSLNQRNADESLSVTRRYVYDANMQLCKTIEPETGTKVTDYDAAGNVLWSASGLIGGDYDSAVDCANSRSAAYGSGRRISRSYDARNRITSLQTPDGRGNQTWSYYPDGLVYESAVDNEGPGQATVKTQYVYNKRRLLTGETLEQVGAYAWSLGYGYDENGNLSASRYPDSTIVTYSPNALGQARQVVNAASGKTYASGVSYYPNGGMSQFTYGNGIVHTMQQNVRQLPSRSADSGVLNYGFSYDRNGNPDAIYDDLRGAHYNRTMQYDGLDRLTAAASASFGGDQWHRFTYDALDNLKSWRLGGIKDYANYVYDANHRLTQIQNSAGNALVNFQYDAQGNVSNKDGQAYQYDFGNRLRAATNKESYRYDAEGRRVQQWSPVGGNILSIYSKSGQLMYTEDHRRSQSLAYLYLNGSQVARIRDFTTPPGAPTPSINVSTTYNGSFVVSWLGSDMAESYTLEESVNGGAWTNVYTGTTVSWSAAGKLPGSYSYRVKACNSKGCSAASNAVTVSVIGAPAAPSIAAPALSTNGAIGVGWSTVATAIRYELEESPNGGAWSNIYNANGNSAALTGRQPGAYSYRVRACNDAGCSGYSSTATTQVVFPPATAPNLSVPGFVSNGAYTASWSSVTHATSYQLEESVNSGAWTLVYDAASTSAGFSSKAAATYSYRVRACNTAGCSGYSASQSVQVLYAPSVLPSISAPAMSTNGAIGVGWSAVATASRYELEENYNGGAWGTIYNANGSNAALTGRQPGSYSYRVRACNDAGCGGYSSTATTQVVFPPATAPNLSVPGFVSNGAYTASWSAVTYGTSYQLEESVNGSAWTLVHDAGSTSAGFSSKAAATYSYRVRACNTAGCSGYSASQSVQVLYPPSGAPAISAPSLSSDGSYGVGWSVVNSADRYELEENINGGGWTLVYNGSASGYSAIGKPDGSYSYRARGCNNAGCSGYSPTGTTQVVRPPAVPGSISAPSSSNGSHAISWSAVGNATSYQLEESINGSGWTPIYIDAGTSTSVGGRTMGSYAYRVRACNAGGCSGYSGNATVSVVVPPAVPTGLGGNKEPFTSTKYYYDVWWDAASGAVYYEVQAGSTVYNAGNWTSLSIQGGTSMWFKVRACNSAGCSAWSSTIYL